MNPPDLKHILEALVFASEKPVSAREIGVILCAAAAAAPEDDALAEIAKAKENDFTNAIDELSAEYAEAGRAFEVRETASGWQFVSSARFAPWLRQLFPESKPARLSAPALETLAIIAYRQPCTRADIEAVRGVAVDGVMTTILDRGLVRIAGRSELPGRPLLYETTTFFMEHFGLRSLDELPNATELRQAAIAAAQEPEPTKTLEGEAPEAEARSEPPLDTTEAAAETSEPDAGQPDIVDEPPTLPTEEVSEKAVGAFAEAAPEPPIDLPSEPAPSAEPPQ